ncbi:ADP,ATP carrier 1, mitochondrial-like [Olea europaea subsp. europaea]|uniref:ADP/ATP translocase n=1 Tax=Olea europaea subsp. europaea TaxID=158383 RepID=A0A8S0P8L0_OLEEU|nr:ADP,ATP carrier 1, mitochondrial-like [Olea europaea subsp. europaea]
MVDFLMGGVSAAVSNTAAAPIERAKLLIWNQDEMIKTGRLSEPYKGIGRMKEYLLSREATLQMLSDTSPPRTRLANDAKAAKKCGERQFNGLIVIYKKILKSDGLAGLYRVFNSSCVGILVHHGLYFGMYNSLRPVVLVSSLQIIENEGTKSLFEGAGASDLLAVAGAGVLAGYDKLQVIVFGKKYGSGGGG